MMNDEKIKKIIKRIDKEIKPKQVKSFVVLDETVYGEVSMFYYNDNNEECVWDLFSAHPYSYAVECARFLADKYNAKVI